MMFREKVAKYIDNRDKGVERTAKVDHIYLTDGASPSVKTVIEILIRDSSDAILIPIPQYPLYSASITRAGGTWIGYELSEDYSAATPSWALDKAVVEKEIKAAKENGKNVRAIAVINPGNPTGNVLSREDQRAVCELAKEHNLVILICRRSPHRLSGGPTFSSASLRGPVVTSHLHAQAHSSCAPPLSSPGATEALCIREGIVPSYPSHLPAVSTFRSIEVATALRCCFH